MRKGARIVAGLEETWNSNLVEEESHRTWNLSSGYPSVPTSVSRLYWSNEDNSWWHSSGVVHSTTVPCPFCVSRKGFFVKGNLESDMFERDKYSLSTEHRLSVDMHRREGLGLSEGGGNLIEPALVFQQVFHGIGEDDSRGRTLALVVSVCRGHSSSPLDQSILSIIRRLDSQISPFHRAPTTFRIHNEQEVN